MEGIESPSLHEMVDQLLAINSPVQGKQSPKPDTQVLLEIISNFPHGECLRQKSYLEQHTEFFIHLFSVSQGKQSTPDICPRIWKHLNDCYKCFEVYSHIMREYYHARHMEKMGKPL